MKSQPPCPALSIWWRTGNRGNNRTWRQNKGAALSCHWPDTVFKTGTHIQIEMIFLLCLPSLFLTYSIQPLSKVSSFCNHWPTLARHMQSMESSDRKTSKKYWRCYLFAWQLILLERRVFTMQCPDSHAATLFGGCPAWRPWTDTTVITTLLMHGQLQQEAGAVGKVVNQ